MTRRKIALVVLGAVVAISLMAASCSSGGPKSGTSNEQRVEASQLKIYDVNQPLPLVPYSQYRQTLIDIEVAQAEGAPSTSFMMPNNGGPGIQPFFSCPSLGFPVHATDQISNPSQIVNSYSNGVSSVAIPQIDPNGVFSGNSSGTYSLCLNKTGQKFGAYWEGNVLTLTGSAAFDTQTGTITDVTNPTGKFNTLTASQQEAVNQAALRAYQSQTQTTTPAQTAPPAGSPTTAKS